MSSQDQQYLTIYMTLNQKSLIQLKTMARQLLNSNLSVKELCKKSQVCQLLSELLVKELPDDTSSSDIQEYIEDICSTLTSKQSCESRMSLTDGENYRDCRWNMTSNKCEKLESLDLRKRATYQVGGSATVTRYKQ